MGRGFNPHTAYFNTLREVVMSGVPIPKHKQVELFVDDKCSIFVDEKIRPLINTMLRAGIVTLHSCQGNMTYKNMNGPAACAADFAYVQFQHDRVSRDILDDILLNFPPLNVGRRITFRVEYHNYKPYGPRVCIRFPQNYIEELERFIYIRYVLPYTEEMV